MCTCVCLSVTEVSLLSFIFMFHNKREKLVQSSLKCYKHIFLVKKLCSEDTACTVTSTGTVAATFCLFLNDKAICTSEKANIV